MFVCCVDLIFSFMECCLNMVLQGWSNERVISTSGFEGGRIVMVLDGDSPSHRNKV